jgi:hypothetical protein
MVVESRGFLVNYKAQANFYKKQKMKDEINNFEMWNLVDIKLSMARKKKSLKCKKIEIFLVQKMNNAKILHLLLK